MSSHLTSRITHTGGHVSAGHVTATLIVSFCAYAFEIPVVSKNPVVDNAIVAPMIANAANTTKIARFVLDDMFDPIENLLYISIV